MTLPTCFAAAWVIGIPLHIRERCPKASCPSSRFHAKSKFVVPDVGLGRSVFRRVSVGKRGARSQGCGVPGWVGPGRKGGMFGGPPPLLRPILQDRKSV